MKVLFASSPIIGHVNPLLVAASVLKNAGHTTAFYTGSLFREKIESAGIRFFSLPVDVDHDMRNVEAVFPERKQYEPGPAKLLFDLKTVFVDAMPSQFRGLEAVLREFPADLVVYETAFFGVLPLLLSCSYSRPAIAHLGITTLLLPREDGAPFGPGLLPATNAAESEHHLEIAQNIDAALTTPLREYTDQILGELGFPGLPMPLLESMAALADVILQPCVPGFEFPLQDRPNKLHFIGALMPEGSGDVPPLVKEAKEAGRTVIMVSQGTVANSDLGQLVAPVIQAYGDRDDVLILVTTGGRPIDSIPCPLSRNTVASQFLNFREVFPYVDVLVAFGGYGTVTQALSFGVPMVVAGQNEDKPENGARVAWTESGIYLRTDDPTAEQIWDAVEQVLSEPTYLARAQQLSLEFAAYDPARELTHLLETLGEDRQAQRMARSYVFEEASPS
jgi:MGT family glycosyltransferase